jgi:hypothetical protein
MADPIDGHQAHPMAANHGHFGRSLLLVLALGGAAAAQGCAAAAVGAAGAGGAYYFTTRGVESTVNGSIDNVASRSQVAMSQMDIPVSGSKSENDGAHGEFTGKKGDLDVTVTLDRNDAKTTKVEVSARRNLVEWDKDYAKQLLDKIVKSG